MIALSSTYHNVNLDLGYPISWHLFGLNCLVLGESCSLTGMI